MEARVSITLPRQEKAGLFAPMVCRSASQRRRIHAKPGGEGGIDQEADKGGQHSFVAWAKYPGRTIIVCVQRRTPVLGLRGEGTGRGDVRVWRGRLEVRRGWGAGTRQT